LLASAAPGCSQDAPETRVRETLSRATEAAASRDVPTLRGLISEGYEDGAGRRRRDIEDALRVWLLRHRNVHVFTLVSEVELASPGRAAADLIVALTGRPVSRPSELREVRADVYRIDLELRDEDGTWRVSRADWQRSTLDDLMP